VFAEFQRTTVMVVEWLGDVEQYLFTRRVGLILICIGDREARYREVSRPAVVVKNVEETVLRILGMKREAEEPAFTFVQHLSGDVEEKRARGAARAILKHAYRAALLDHKKPIRAVSRMCQIDGARKVQARKGFVRGESWSQNAFSQILNPLGDGRRPG